MAASMWRVSGAMNRALFKAGYVSISWLCNLLLALRISNINLSTRALTSRSPSSLWLSLALSMSES